MSARAMALEVKIRMGMPLFGKKGLPHFFRLPHTSISISRKKGAGPFSRFAFCNNCAAFAFLQGGCMFRARISWLAGLAALLALAVATPEAQRGGGGAPAPPPTPLSTVVAKPDARVQKLKEAASADVASMYDLGQQMIDMVFSYGELGFQEFETTKYLTGILKQNGFAVETGVAGIPPAWVAKWGTGKPAIALGSDVDCIPQASQKPGVAYHDPILEGAPGHGEGHNSGMPLQIAAALAVKKIMEQQHLQGTLKLWPGVAEELLGTKAYYVRAGMFKDVDICIFAHVGAQMN